jgi:activator of HSP90 ATPase
VWKALVEPTLIERWGAGPGVVMDEEPGTAFRLWGGEIRGKNIVVDRWEKLVQEWYGGDWDEPSIVTFALSEKNGNTSVVLTHTNIPDNEAESIERGWDEDYMFPLKDLAERI